MKNQIFYWGIVCLTLTACIPAKATPLTAEERTLFTILDNMEWGMGWDRHCVGLDRDVDTHLYNNVQQLILQLGNALDKQLPADASDKEREDHMLEKVDAHTDALRPKIDKILEEEGCASKSKKITDAKRAYDLFSKTPPEKMNIVVRQQVEKAIKAGQ